VIGRLRGKIILKQPPRLMLDVQGVGYEVDATMSTFYQLPEVGQEVVLHTHLIVREDAHLLFGFVSEAERSLFRNLIKVSGIGARTALVILSGMSADQFARCVIEGDVTSLVKLPGVGKKTAERLVIELRDRLDVHDSVAHDMPAIKRTTVASPVDDAQSALIALGYKPAEATRMVQGIDSKGLDTENIIRLCLQNAVKQK
jgi:holliday junction DNA helicase RuvA